MQPSHHTAPSVGKSHLTHVAAHNVPPKTRLTENPTLAASAVVQDCRLGRYTEVGEQAHMSDSVLDDYSYLSRGCDVMSADIGKFSNIAAMVRINPGFHPLERPTLHNFTYRWSRYGLSESDDDTYFEWRRRQRVVIGHDTWIGHGVVIMPGVRIGHGAVVGSNSVVTRDVPDYAIVAGAPARLLRMRFPAAIAQALLATAWWDWERETLEQRLPDFSDLRRFLKRYAPPV